MQPNHNDWQNLPQYLESFAQIADDFIRTIDQRPTAAKRLSAPALELPEQGMPLSPLMSILRREVIPNLSASRGPRYWGFVTGGATPIATMADWLVSVFDQNVSKGGDSCATAIERQTIEWLLQLFELPNAFKGTLTTGATAANFLAAVTARQFAGQKQSINIAEDGLYSVECEVYSATPHASMLKALGLAGLGRKQYHSVACLPGSEAMDVDALAQALAQSPSKGKIVIASAATVSGTDFDDLTAIRALCDQHDAWLHVDAAFGIFERLLKGKTGRTQGIETADSITLDAHKWLNVPYDCGVFLTRHRQLLFDSCDVPAPYLVGSNDEPDFMSLGIENSRRFRALPVWMSLLGYGREGIRSWIAANVSLAASLARWLDTSDAFELMYYGELNVVLFRPTAKGLTTAQADHRSKAVLAALNADGRVFMSPGVWQGHQVIRAALSNWQTHAKDLETAKTALIDALNDIAQA